jgi:hypothetical protein
MRNKTQLGVGTKFFFLILVVNLVGIFKLSYKTSYKLSYKLSCVSSYDKDEVDDIDELTNI